MDRFFYRRVPLHPLALARIGIGLSLFGGYAAYAPELDALVGKDGLIRFLYRDGGGPWWGFSYLSYTAVLIASLAFALGYRTRIAGIVLFAGHEFFLQLISHRLFWGWGSVIPAFVLYLTVAPSGRVCSLDAWDASRKGDLGPLWRRVTGPGWVFRLLQIHICCIFVAAAVHRLDDPGWLRGEMLLMALDFSMYSRFPYLELYDWRLVLAVLCYLGWLLELAAPITLWLPRLRVPTAVSLLAFHLVLELTSTTGRWQTMMMSVLVVFLPPRASQAILARLSSGFQRAVDWIEAITRRSPARRRADL